MRFTSPRGTASTLAGYLASCTAEASQLTGRSAAARCKIPGDQSEAMCVSSVTMSVLLIAKWLGSHRQWTAAGVVDHGRLCAAEALQHPRVMHQALEIANIEGQF
jgi:hypothetical protein